VKLAASTGNKSDVIEADKVLISLFNLHYLFNSSSFNRSARNRAMMLLLPRRYSLD
jgi:hypothetical protein